MDFILFHRKFFLQLTILMLVSLSACNLPRSGDAGVPTMNVTQAYQTVEAHLTQGVALTPVSTPTLGPTDSGVITPSPTLTGAPSIEPPTLPAATKTLEPSCDLAAPGSPIDVTIPDDTQMNPGQAFTKVWRLQNVGTCTWTKDYAVVWFSGEQMGASASIALAGNVAPGQTVEISVDMQAPQAAGTFRSNWKLRNASNVLFGIGPSGNSSFWVQIVVVPLPTTTPTPATTTPTPSPTPTTAVQASGSFTLLPGQQLNLDSAQVDSGSGEDLVYESTSDGTHVLTPQNGALIGVYGSGQPNMADCQSAALSDAPLAVDNLAPGTYLCYHTGQGLPGRAIIAKFNVDDYSLALDILTWSLP